jgi:hypothetical protein
VDAVLRLGVNDGHRNALEQSQGQVPLLAVPEAIILVGERSAAEYPLGIRKIEPVVLQVALALNLVPRKPHGTSVYSLCIYSKPYLLMSFRGD